MKAVVFVYARAVSVSVPADDTTVFLAPELVDAVRFELTLPPIESLSLMS